MQYIILNTFSVNYTTLLKYMNYFYVQSRNFTPGTTNLRLWRLWQIWSMRSVSMSVSLKVNMWLTSLLELPVSLKIVEFLNEKKYKGRGISSSNHSLSPTLLEMGQRFSRLPCQLIFPYSPLSLTDFHLLKFEIWPFWTIVAAFVHLKRLGAPTSSWRQFGLLDFVLRAFRPHGEAMYVYRTKNLHKP